MPTAPFHVRVSSIHPVSGWMLGAFVGLHTLLLLAVHTPAFTRGLATVGIADWVSPGLGATLLMALVLVAGLLVGVGGLRAADLGLPTGWAAGWRGLDAVLLTYLVWGLAQLLVVGLGLLGIATVTVDATWGPPLRSEAGEASLAFVLAGAALEEVLYRGFFFVHLFLALRRWGVPGRRWQMGGALAGSQLLFGLNHIPVGMNTGLSGSLLALYVLQVALVGVLFAVLFLQTNNLLLVMGVHVLINKPALPFVADIDSSLLVLGGTLALALAHPVLGRMGAVGRRPPPPVGNSASPARPVVKRSGKLF